MFRPRPTPEGVSGTLQLPWRFQVQNPLTDNQEKAGGFPPAHACPPVEAPPAPLTGIFFTGRISGAERSGVRQSPGAEKTKHARLRSQRRARSGAFAMPTPGKMRRHPARYVRRSGTRSFPLPECAGETPVPAMTHRPKFRPCARCKSAPQRAKSLLLQRTSRKNDLYKNFFPLYGSPKRGCPTEKRTASPVPAQGENIIPWRRMSYAKRES